MNRQRIIILAALALWFTNGLGIKTAATVHAASGYDDAHSAPHDNGHSNWWERTEFSGDFKYRYDRINDRTKYSTDPRYQKNTLRARLKAKFHVDDEWDLLFRVGTGNAGNPVTANENVGSAFSFKEAWIDRAQAIYNPLYLPGATVHIGKMGLPFFTAGHNEMIFSYDLAPEGGAIQYGFDACEGTHIGVNAGAFWVVERHGSSTNLGNTDSGLFAIQALVEQELMEDSKLKGGVSFYQFTHIKNQQALYKEFNSNTSSKFFGNSSAGGLYHMDYALFELFLDFSSACMGIPYSVFGSYVTNTDAETHVTTAEKEDTGYIFGFTINELKKKCDWMIAYDYREVEADAVIGQFNDYYFLGGNTGGKGHRISGALKLADSVKIVLTNFFDNQFDASHGVSKDGKRYDRWHLDLVLKTK